MQWIKVSNGFEREQVLSGESTETKPTTEFDGIGISNGTFFVENNTGDVYYFTKATSTWALFG